MHLKKGISATAMICAVTYNIACIWGLKKFTIYISPASTSETSKQN